jgi:hypothetical protein
MSAEQCVPQTHTTQVTDACPAPVKQRVRDAAVSSACFAWVAHVSGGRVRARRLDLRSGTCH